MKWSILLYPLYIIGIMILIIWFFLILDYSIMINGESNPNFMFFPSSNISYSFSPENPCLGERAKRIHLAFNIIENKTQGLLFFQYEPDEYYGDIEIDCYTEDFGRGLAGEGGPVYYEGEREILGGEISLFPSGEEYIECESYPSEEIHEILHVFSFDHIDDEESIMFEGFDEIILYEDEDDQIYVCQKIEKEIVECLKNIYSNGVNGSSCENLPSLCFSRFCPTEIGEFILAEPKN